MIAGLERLSSFQLKRARIEPSAERLALASHPPAPERLAALRAAVAKSSAVQGKTGRERYVAALSGMAFGEDGRSGFVRGRTFMHPALDIAMTLPQGYILRGARASVTALSEGGKTAVLFTRLPAQAAGDPEGALRRMLASVSSSAEFSQLPGGLNGASALTRKDKAAVRTVVFETGGKPYRMVFATKEHSPAFDRDAAAVLASVRALTGGDQRRARPLTLRIERGASASALRQLAERAGNADHGAELILALNGLKSPSELRPGLALKVPELTAE